MADRTSAYLFGAIFEMLAENPTDENKAFAFRIYDMTDTYDFNMSQMGVDEALIALDLAKVGKDEYGQDCTLYLYEDYKRQN